MGQPAQFEICHTESTPERLVIRDVGHRTCLSVTNDAEGVVAYLVRLGHLKMGRRLFYYDSTECLDEIVIRWPAGVFAGFRPGAIRSPIDRMIDAA